MVVALDVGDEQTDKFGTVAHRLGCRTRSDKTWGTTDGKGPDSCVHHRERVPYSCRQRIEDRVRTTDFSYQ